jgi:HNH endonuclease
MARGLAAVNIGARGSVRQIVCADCGAEGGSKAVGKVRWYCQACRAVRVAAVGSGVPRPAARPTGNRRCKACAGAFIAPSPHTVTCSPECFEAWGLAKAEAAQAAWLAAAAGHSIEAKPFAPMAVYERDGWQCQRCGVAIPPALRGVGLGRKEAGLGLAPAVHYIVPLEEGGAHTAANVQLVCRCCQIELEPSDDDAEAGPEA